MAIQGLRAPIPEVREAARTGLDRLRDSLSRCVGVAQADPDAQGNRQGNGFDRPPAFRRQSQQQQIVTRGRPELANPLGQGIAHAPRIMRSAIPGLFGQKRPFDVPPGNGRRQFGGTIPERSQTSELVEHALPGVGHKRGQEPRAARPPQPSRRRQQGVERHNLSLEIDPRVAIDLEIQQARGNPVIGRCRLGQLLDARDPPVLTRHTERALGEIMARQDNRGGALAR